MHVLVKLMPQSVTRDFQRAPSRRMKYVLAYILNTLYDNPLSAYVLSTTTTRRKHQLDSCHDDTPSSSERARRPVGQATGAAANGQALVEGRAGSTAGAE